MKKAILDGMKLGLVLVLGALSMACAEFEDIHPHHLWWVLAGSGFFIVAMELAARWHTSFVLSMWKNFGK